MKRMAIVVFVTLTLTFAVVATSALAAVATFDDIGELTDPDWYGEIPYQYAGLGYWGWPLNDYTHDIPFGAHSGQYSATAFSYYYLESTIFSGTGASGIIGAQWDFNGVWLAASVDEYAITVKGYYGEDNELYSSDITLAEADTWYWFEFNYLGIDRVSFDGAYTGSNQDWWFMDDFTFNQTTVPIPAGVLLLGSGLLGLAGLRRRAGING